MAPIQIERKDGWAVGLKPQDKVATVNPGEGVKLSPSHDVILEISCDSDDEGGFVEIASKSLEVVWSADPGVRYPSVGAAIVKGDSIKIRGSQGQELAEIKHVPAKSKERK